MTSLTLKTALNRVGWNGKLFTHWMGWHGSPGKVNHITRYISTDPWVLHHQLDAMQAVGIDGVIATWQGPTIAPFLHQATMNLCEQLEDRGMLFALLLDPWTGKGQKNPTQSVIDAINHPDTLEMLSSSAYLPEKYILEFDLASSAGVVVPTVVAAFPKTPIISKHIGYSWPEITNTLPTLAVDNANPSMRIPGMCLRFFDGGATLPLGSLTNFPVWVGSRDYNSTVWASAPGQPSRVLESQAGNFYLDQIALLPTKAPYAALITWNDYDEGTEIEPFCTMMAGIRIGR